MFKFLFLIKYILYEILYIHILYIDIRIFTYVYIHTQTYCNLKFFTDGDTITTIF